MDRVSGGPGQDTFIFRENQFNRGYDTITDFTPGEDVLKFDFVGLGAGDVSYDPATGLLSIDGTVVADIGEDNAPEDTDYEFF